MFPPKTVLEIAEKLLLKDQKSIIRLGVDLASLAEQFIELENSADLEPTPTEKSRWLRKHILEPAAALRDSLDRDNARMYVEALPNHQLEFIDDQKSCLTRVETKMVRKGRKIKTIETGRRLDVRNGPLRTRLLRDLDQIIEWAESKSSRFRDKKQKRKWLRTQYREELVYSLLKVFLKYQSSNLLVRSDYGFRPAGASSRNNSPFSVFVRLTAAPIVGRRANFDDQIKLAISRYKKERKSGDFNPHFFPYLQEDNT